MSQVGGNSYHDGATRRSPRNLGGRMRTHTPRDHVMMATRRPHFKNCSGEDRKLQRSGGRLGGIRQKGRSSVAAPAGRHQSAKTNKTAREEVTTQQHHHRSGWESAWRLLLAKRHSQFYLAATLIHSRKVRKSLQEKLGGAAASREGLEAGPKKVRPEPSASKGKNAY